MQVQVQCSQRQHQLTEQELIDERDKLQQQLAEEKKAHTNIEAYLKKHTEVATLQLHSVGTVGSTAQPSLVPKLLAMK